MARRYADYFDDDTIYISSRYPTVSMSGFVVLKQNIYELKNLVQSRDEVTILCNEHFTISTDTFENFTGHSITLINILLEGDKLPDCVTHFSTDRHDQKPFNVKKLTIRVPKEEFTVPPSVESLILSGGNDATTIIGHDNLKEFSLYYSESIVHLSNCNNLERVITLCPSVYGEFVNYLSELVVISGEDIEELYKYLSLFKSLTIYSGYIDKTVLGLLPNLREIHSNLLDIESLDDIPDSLEVMHSTVRRNGGYITPRAVLQAKPNIRRIKAYGDDLYYLLEERDDVEIVLHDDYYEGEGLYAMVENHNKKLKSLSALA